MDILDKVKQQTGKTDEDIAAALIGLLQNKQTAASAAWKNDAAKYQKDTGLTGSLHDGDEYVEFAELGVVFKNHLQRDHGKA